MGEITNHSQNPLVSGVKAAAEGFNAIGDVAGEAVRSIPGGNKVLDTTQKVIGKGMGMASDALSNTSAIKSIANHTKEGGPPIVTGKHH